MDVAILTSPMFHTFQVNQTYNSEDFNRVFTIYGHDGLLDHSDPFIETFITIGHRCSTRNYSSVSKLILSLKCKQTLEFWNTRDINPETGRINETLQPAIKSKYIMKEERFAFKMV